MKRYILYWTILIICTLSGCAKGGYESYNPPSYEFDGAPRLVIRGQVQNESDAALEGIHVAVYGVRAENEKDVPGYNFALTDTAGEYTIIRYRGREMPSSITVVATDLNDVYSAQDEDFEVRYDSVGNGFVTADFVLKAQ